MVERREIRRKENLNMRFEKTGYGLDLSGHYEDDEWGDSVVDILNKNLTGWILIKNKSWENVIAYVTKYRITSYGSSDRSLVMYFTRANYKKFDNLEDVIISSDGKEKDMRLYESDIIYKLEEYSEEEVEWWNEGGNESKVFKYNKYIKNNS